MKLIACSLFPSLQSLDFNLSVFYLVGKTVPKMDLIRKHLMIEGHIKKDCLVRIIQEVTEIYSKS